MSGWIFRVGSKVLGTDNLAGGPDLLPPQEADYVVNVEDRLEAEQVLRATVGADKETAVTALQALDDDTVRRYGLAEGKCAQAPPSF